MKCVSQPELHKIKHSILNLLVTFSPCIMATQMSPLFTLHYSFQVFVKLNTELPCPWFSTEDLEDRWSFLLLFSEFFSSTKFFFRQRMKKWTTAPG